MKLTPQAEAMLAGELGPARQWAVSHQLQVGRVFDAADMVDVSQAHMMADTESTGEAGVRFVEDLAALPLPERLVAVPMITDPRGRILAEAGAGEAIIRATAPAAAGLNPLAMLIGDGVLYLSLAVLAIAAADTFRRRS